MPKHTLPLDIFVTYFSAYSAHAIDHEGVLYPTVEHAYHCLRYSDQAIIKEVLSAKSPVQAWQISQKYKTQQIADFSKNKVTIMEMLCATKFQQHADVQQALQDSGDAEIVKHITTGPPTDGFWDDGADGNGRNESGKIWMRIRNRVM